MSRTYGRRVAALALLVCSALACDPPPADAAIRTPEGLTAAAVSSSTMQLTWIDTSTDETGYEIRRSLSSTPSTFVTIATTVANTTGYLDTGLAAGTEYFYRARARRNSSYSSWSTMVSATTPSTSGTAPTITTQPLNQVVTAPAAATFSVTATGTAPLSYQWQKNGAAIAGATNAVYTTPATSVADSGASFRVVVTNSVSAVTSAVVKLTVNAAPDTTAPIISGAGVSGVSQTAATIGWTTDEPANGQIEYGQTSAYGQATSINPSLVTTHSQALGGLAAGTLYHYRIKSRDGAGNLAVSGDSSFSTTTAAVAPTITAQPVSRTVAAPATATFAVTATGTAPLSYQWQKNGVAIAGATSAGYTTPATTTADSGSSFRVVVTNSAGNRHQRGGDVDGHARGAGLPPQARRVDRGDRAPERRRRGRQ